MRLLDVGCGWGGMVRHAAEHYGVTALGVTLSREQATWAQEAIEARGPRRPRRGAAQRLPRRRRDRLRRGQLDRPDRAHRRAQLPGVLPLPARPAARRGPAAQPLHHPARQPAPRAAAARLHRPLRLPRRRADRRRATSSARCRTPGLEVRHEENLREHYARTLRGWCAQPRRATGTSASPRRATAPPGCGASTWPGRGSASSATRSSCTRCWRRARAREGVSGFPLRPRFEPADA